MTLVRGLREAEARLAGLDIAQAVTDALDAAAKGLEAKVTEVLSHPPGTDHSVPWLRTGALRASISHVTDGNVAVVGSTSDVAVDQELGTRTIPPRPFLASTAANSAEATVASIATALAHHLADHR
jgi:negative regulator of sigma E activity